MEWERNKEKTLIWGREKRVEKQGKNENRIPFFQLRCSLPPLLEVCSFQDQHKHAGFLHLSISIHDLTCQTKETLKNKSIFSRESDTPCFPFHRSPVLNFRALPQAPLLPSSLTHLPCPTPGELCPPLPAPPCTVPELSPSRGTHPHPPSPDRSGSKHLPLLWVCQPCPSLKPCSSRESKQTLPLPSSPRLRSYIYTGLDLLRIMTNIAQLKAQPNTQTALEGRPLATLKILLKPSNTFHAMKTPFAVQWATSWHVGLPGWSSFSFTRNFHPGTLSVLSSFHQSPQISRILVWTQSDLDQPSHIPIVPRAFWKHGAHLSK